MIKKLFDAAITGIWCFLWVIPAFLLYFAALVFSDLIIKSKLNSQKNGKSNQSGN